LEFLFFIMKIAIIGGGVCGLYLAWRLSEKGFEVIVFEKNKKIGKEACSGLFSQRIFYFIPQSERLVQNKIKYTLLHFPHKTIKVNFSKNFFVMRHYELDRLVLSLAEKAGAKIILEKKIEFLPEGFDKIIGCDGANSKVRSLLGLKNPNFRLGIQGFVSEHNSSDFVETWPTKNGFLWKIPRGDETEYGIIEKPELAKNLLDKFLKERRISLYQIKSALIPQGFVIPSELDVTLCGDAAGLTKPWSGGGVIWGLMACDILLKNFPDFLKYRKELKKIFLPKIYLSKIATKMVYFLGFKIPRCLSREYKIESDFLI